MFSKITRQGLLFSTCLSLAAASAIPVPASELSTRVSGELLYLANCYYQGSAESYMVYYADGKCCSQSGQDPNDFGYATGPGNGWVTWEGNTITASEFYYNNGVSATSHIQANGANLATGQYAGYASNSAGQGFNCYKDNGRQLFSENVEGSLVCYSIYYCDDA